MMENCIWPWTGSSWDCPQNWFTTFLQKSAGAMVALQVHFLLVPSLMSIMGAAQYVMQDAALLSYIDQRFLSLEVCAWWILLQQESLENVWMFWGQDSLCDVSDQEGEFPALSNEWVKSWLKV